jgi:hypothetical protein
MRLRQAATVPAVAAIALSGAVAFGGCGSDSNAATNESTTGSMHHEAMKHDGDTMKHEGEATKHQGKAMQHEGSSADEMKG